MFENVPVKERHWNKTNNPQITLPIFFDVVASQSHVAISGSLIGSIGY